MKKTKLFGLVLIVFAMGSLTACGGDFARRADGTCVFICNGGGGGGAAAGG